MFFVELIVQKCHNVFKLWTKVSFMNIQTLSTKADKLAVNVLIKNEQGGNVSAMVLGRPEYRVLSSDRPSAITKLEKLLTDTLSSGEVVLLELEIPKPDHPWQKFAGIYKDSELYFTRS